MLSIMMNVDKSKFDDREFKEYYHFDFQKFLLYDSRVKLLETNLQIKYLLEN